MSQVPVAVLPAPHQPIELRTVREPDLEPGGALLAVEVSEVCGTDVHLQAGRLAGVPYPIIPGHVAIGRLEKIRGTLQDVHGVAFEEGERVTFLDVHRTCHACWVCLVAKASTRCPARKVYGITYGLADGLTGGWAAKLYLKPGTRCIRAGDVEADRFMAGGCGLPTALHAVERGGVRIGDTVVVLGSGPVGLSAVIFARMAGALQVLCIGAPAGRLATARAVGADATCDITAVALADRVAWVHEHTAGRGADVTIEATGRPEAVAQAMAFAREAGRVVIVGQYTDHGSVSINPHHDLNRKHLDVLGCWGSDFSHFYRCTRLLADDRRSEPWTRIPLERYGLGDCNVALARVASGDIVKALIDPNLAS